MANWNMGTIFIGSSHEAQTSERNPLTKPDRRGTFSKVLELKDILHEMYSMDDVIHYEDIEYLSYLPPVVMELCSKEELDWIGRQYNSDKFTTIRERYIDIQRQLKDEPRGPKRTELVEQASKLERLDFSDLGL